MTPVWYAALADALGVTPVALAYCLRGPYRHVEIVKRRVGTGPRAYRTVSVPAPLLKRAQRGIAAMLATHDVTLHDSCHGFRPRRDIFTAALPHVGRPVVVGLDIAGFYPSVTFPRVKGLFRQLGSDERIAHTLARLCCDRGTLATGSPASPAVTNLLCRRLDARLAGVAARWGFVYTRYADDLTFSGTQAHGLRSTLLRDVRRVLEAENLREHAEKTRIACAPAHRFTLGLLLDGPRLMPARAADAATAPRVTGELTHHRSPRPAVDPTPPAPASSPNGCPLSNARRVSSDNAHPSTVCDGSCQVTTPPLSPINPSR